MTVRLIVCLVILATLAIAATWVCYPSRPDPKSSDPAERLAAVAELVGRSDPASLGILIELVGDSDPRVAAAAVRAIGRGKAPENRVALRKILAENDSGALRGEAAAALGRFKSADFQVLIETLLNDNSPKARIGAARGLERLRLPKSAKMLAGALKDVDANVRHAAFIAIGRITATYFKFDPTADPETQKENIETIKKVISQLGVEHPN